MESLKMEKFNDKKLSKNKLSYIIGGHCTGGGFSRYGRLTISWEADDYDPFTGGTTYTGLKSEVAPQ